MRRLLSVLAFVAVGVGCRKDVTTLDLDGDGITADDGDCGPGDAATFPQAPELCDGRDNDCDTEVDEGVGSPWLADADGDGFGDDAAVTTSCDAPAGAVSTGGDCDDADARVNPAARELCTDATDWNCDGAPGAVDADGDGVPGCEDCADDDKTVFPGAAETCNDADDDCDGDVDEDAGDATDFFVDLDGDGFGSDRLVATACEAPEGFVADSDDCDDLSAVSYPAAPEACDGLDNDCNATIDDGATGTATYWADADKDGFGDPNGDVEACARPAGYVDNFGDCDDGNAAFNPQATETCSDPNDYNCDGSVGQADGDADGTPACSDCDDGDATVEPGAPEICDGVDNDCNGQTDETAPTWYADVDGDKHGGTALTVVACVAPGGFVASADDCDDLAAAAYPGATEACNGRDDDCAGGVPADETDGDGDRWRSCEGDCDDADATALPGGVELCDAVDNDCDGTPDDVPLDAVAAYADSDGDGFGAGSPSFVCSIGTGFAATAGDCNDGLAAIKPGATEACNSADDDCDGTIDEAGATGGTAFYLDADGDGLGGSKVMVTACVAPAGYVATSSDCDDTNVLTYLGATELCDGLDNNCDKASVAGEADGDKDNWRACGGDCNDASKAVSPSATELCNGVDDDCDGTIDQNATGAVTWFADGDTDGWGTGATTKVACTQPSGYVAVGGDCNDTSKAISPSADELCTTSGDDDCDGASNEQDARDASVWYQDGDGDGHGTPANFTLACTQPSGRVAIADDCNDAKNTIYTGATETWYDGVDSNCDGKNDFDQDGDGLGAYSKGAGNDCNDTNAAESVCGTTAGTALTSCATLLAARPGLASGVYWLDADGSAGPKTAFQVYCDNVTAGGGWTLLLKAQGTDLPFESAYWTDNNLLNTGSTTPDWTTSAKFQSFLDVPVQQLLLKSQFGNSTQLTAPVSRTMQGHFQAPTTVLTHVAGSPTAHHLVNGLDRPLCGPAWRINTYVNTSRAIRLGSWQTYTWSCGYGNDASGNDTSAEFFGFGIRDVTWSPWTLGGKSFGIRQAHDYNTLPGGGQIQSAGHIYGR